MGYIKLKTIFKCKNKIVESEKNTILQQKIHEIFQENDFIEYMLYNDIKYMYKSQPYADYFCF